MTNSTFISNADEREIIEKLEKILNQDNDHPKLVSNNGETLVLPESVYNALRQIVHGMAQGKACLIVPKEHELTSQEAADLLNVSRPYLINQLLNTGILPFVKVGKHHRIRLQDVMTYKDKRDQERRQNLREFSQFLQEQGCYD